jgi:hypothetical protein
MRFSVSHHVSSNFPGALSMAATNGSYALRSYGQDWAFLEHLHRGGGDWHV